MWVEGDVELRDEVTETMEYGCIEGDGVLLRGTEEGDRVYVAVLLELSGVFTSSKYSFLEET